ncbi:MAG TPA: chromosome segregation protein SMC [Verrucomicrobiae bacterium]|nr:chromosome segregation protein SMC [Verrucomicrobiae bacterium]
MYLKSIQLIGFKSFAEKTTLDFLPGVTAIVGPNGCGKSNISDAIRWVLGEQSAKALRGSEMADVIFNGTDGRKAINLAEVSMTFADVDPQTLSLPGVNLDFTEVTITRRVHRDGNGEYFINKTPCRLRDIQSLFMDTGIGRSSYSLMAQGQLDQILSAHPEDRRTIFEEAAGINKYKHQKKEALRKLEYTEANLVRITDIIKEVKRQIISLQRQAGKARRYKELFDQLKALDTRLARHKHDLLHSEISNLESEIANFVTQSDAFSAQIAEKEQQITDLRRSLSEIEHAINEAVTRDHELKNEADRHEQRMTTNAERITELEQLIENHHRETAGAEEKIRVQEELLKSLNAEFAQIDSLLATEQAKLRAQQDAVRQLEADLAQKNALANDAKTALIDLESAIAHGRNELSALDQKKKYDVVRAQRLSTERLQLEDQRRALEQRLQAYNDGLAELRSGVDTLRAATAAKQTELHSVSSLLAAATNEHHVATSDVSSKRARLEVLQQFFAAPDGRSTLGQILDVQSQYGAAIEAALNHAIHTILADDLAAARQLLGSDLQNPAVAVPELISRGGASVPACDQVSASTEALITNTGTVALSVVQVRDPRFEPLVRSLLANAVIVNDLDAALALRQNQPHLAVATLGGEFVDQHGILSVVSHSHIGEIAGLTQEVAQLDARVSGQEATRAELEQKKAALETELSALRAELHAKEIALASKEGELNALATEGRDLESKVHTVVFELQAIEQQDAEEKKRRETILAGLRESEARQVELQQQMTAAQRAVDELLVGKEQMTLQLTELRVSVGGIEHKRHAIESQREPIAARVRDLRERIQTCADEITSYTARIRQFRTEIAESEAAITELTATRAQSQQHIDGLQHQRAEVATGISQAEEELRAVRKQASDAQSQKSGLEIQLAQKRMEAQNLKDRVWQKYQVNVEDVRGETINITIADQGPAITEQVPMPVDWDAIELQVTEMQSKLDAMGPVNVEAIQEYDELEERYKFLTQQHEDLVKAKDQLLQVISKINVTTKQLFQETFEKVRENFQMMYAELFGGGKANLILLDESDPLESGIEIVAKPPGKQLQSITLLSGGERALTATALLFAIYMVKPSPFCVLDEMDAPLDESNINRFVRILQRFITQSQFVIITHNKRTIGMADALYGITMEEHGVSKVVSVKFSPREETERKQSEKQREEQEDRIDGAASAPQSGSPDKDAFGALPHEEELHNDLLEQKEQTIAPIAETAPVIVENEPALGQPAPDDIKAEVQAAIAAAAEASEVVEQTVEEATPKPTEGDAKVGPSDSGPQPA